MDSTRTGNPYVVGKEDVKGHLLRLERMPLSREGSEIDEKRLQFLIDQAPNILPASQVYSRVGGDLHSLGREVATSSGSIDNLLISGSGHVIVVETKLWRNPQARREVVAQILEYSQDVRDWDYEKIEQLWRDRHAQGQTLQAAVATEASEAEWIDQVNDQLAAGEILLLIVGDGIDSRAETLADTVSSQPRMAFRLALVELRLYSLDEQRYLIVPSTMSKTSEIQRATVRVVYESTHKPSVGVNVPAPDHKRRTARGNRDSLEETQFLSLLEEHKNGGLEASKVAAELLRQLYRHDEFSVDWKPTGFSVRTPDPASPGKTFPLAVTSFKGRIYTHLPHISNRIRSKWGIPSLADRVEDKFLALYRRWGGERARQTRNDTEIEIPYTVLAGIEKEAVDSLCDIVRDLRNHAPRTED